MRNELEKAKELLQEKGYTVVQEKVAEKALYGISTAIGYLNEHKPFELACIVYSNESYLEDYPLESRMYLFNEDNKVFKPNALGYSLYGDSLDKTDTGVRLEAYINWKILATYILKK